MNNTDTSLYFLIGLIVFFISGVLFYGFVELSIEFTRELRQINREISRSNHAEKKYWKKQRLRLWLSLIPFIKY